MSPQPPLRMLAAYCPPSGQEELQVDHYSLHYAYCGQLSRTVLAQSSIKATFMTATAYFIRPQDRNSPAKRVCDTLRGDEEGYGQ